MALESAITLLEKQAELQPTCKLHQMLGDLLARVHEEEKALEQYSIALK
jgi:predicted negative regulator of RcsB-dependent stress response